MKKLLTIALALVMALSFAACSSASSSASTPAPADSSKAAGSSAPAESVAAGKTLEVVLITMDSMDEHWLYVKAGAQAKADELGNINLTFTAPAGKTDPNEQVRMVEDAITRKVDALLLAPLDKAALAPPVEKAKAAGIPVIIIDSPVDTEEYDAFFSTDNEQAARMAADELAKLIGEKGKVAIINAQAGSGTAMLRENGFKDQMKEKYPNIEIVSVQYSEGDKAKALNQATDIMTANPDLAGFYACNEGSTVGVAQAIAQKNVAGKIMVVGFDISNDTINALKENHIQATLVQNPYQMGFLGLQAAVDVINGLEVERHVDTGVQVITAENVDTLGK